VVIPPSGEWAGLGAGLSVVGCAMAAGGIVIIVKRKKAKVSPSLVANS
jgi:hypothetical protein